MTDRTSRAVAPVSAVCAAFRTQSSVFPTGSLKTGRCAAVRERWQKTSEQDEMAAGKAACGKCGNTPKRAKSRDFGRRGEKAARKQEKRLGAFLRQPVHFCPQCGQFRGMKMALFCGC